MPPIDHQKLKIDCLRTQCGLQRHDAWMHTRRLKSACGKLRFKIEVALMVARVIQWQRRRLRK
jgi:hypothetical protein